MEQDEDNLENFFRKALRSSDIDFNEDDWAALEKRLEAESSRLSTIRVKRFGKIISAFISISIVFFLVLVAIKDNPGERHNDLGKKSFNDSLKNDSEESTKAPAIAKIHEETLDRIIYENEKSLPEIKETNEMTTSADEKMFSDAALVEKPDANSGDNGDSLKITSTQNKMNGKMPGVCLLEKPFKELIPILESPDFENKYVKDSILFDQGTPSIHKKRLISNRFSLLLYVAPDFSNITPDQFTSPGMTFGIVARYRVSNTLSFSTGILKSNKKYISDGKDYQLAENYWKYNTNGMMPETIYGSCSVLEIPAAIQFTVSETAMARFFASSGFSSYIILDESYRYHFDQPNPGAKEGWYTNKNSSYIFKVVTISMGYERNILSKFSIGVEPYVKIPLEGIGWPNVRLISAGVAVTAGY
ncbi:MAG TPA: hypothetical protein PLV21_03725 [Cyclobacteriaceae bacterium]|nr:hypothetical protein [Cyclobacteriaceae bacterium]HRJ80968.1 hypothetical protein [Cyclobacteriaceae bacterium]